MKRLMGRIREWARNGESFNDIFCYTNGWFESRAARDPENMYTAEEIAELFNLLFDVKHDEAV